MDSESRRVRCGLKGHNVIELEGQVRCMTCNKVLKERSLMCKIKIKMRDHVRFLGNLDCVDRSAIITLLLVSFLVPIGGWIVPLVSFYLSLVDEDSHFRRLMRTISYYSVVLALMSTLALVMLL